MPISLTGSILFETYPTDAFRSSAFGTSLAGGRDVNGDGYADLVIGSDLDETPRDSNGNIIGLEADPGAVYVVYGTATGFAAQVDLADASTWNGFRIEGSGNDSIGYGGFGNGELSLGDINGDLKADILIGAAYASTPGPNPINGLGYVVFGGVQSDGGAFTDVLELASFTATDGYALTSQNADAGFQFTALGDIDSDGVEEFGISMPRTLEDDVPGAVAFGGLTYVFDTLPDPANFGTSEPLLDLNTDPDGSGPLSAPAPGTYFISTETVAFSGASVAPIGDFDGDTIDDFAISAPSAGDDFGSFGSYLTRISGVTFIVSGREASDPFTAIEALDAFNSGADVPVDGVTKLVVEGVSSFGNRIAGIGDVNNDGKEDLLVYASQEFLSNSPTDFNTGVAYIVYGQDAPAPLLNLSDVSPTTTATDGSTIPVYSKISGFGGFGFSQRYDFEGVGDVNQDGFDDFVIGSAHLDGADVGGPDTGDGIAALIFGKAGGLGADFEITQLDGTNGYLFGVTDTTLGDTELGASIAGLGDVNGDQAADFALGAPEWSAVGTNTGLSGATVVVYGGTDLLAQADAADGTEDGFIDAALLGALDDGAVTYSLGPDVSVAEGDDGFKTVTLSATRTDGTGAATLVLTTSVSDGITFDFGNSDIGILSNVFTFQDGETTATLQLRIEGDRDFEQDEWVEFTVAEALDANQQPLTDVAFGDQTARVTILNDDIQPPVTYNFNPEVTVVEGTSSDGTTTDGTISLWRGNTQGAAQVQILIDTTGTGFTSADVDLPSLPSSALIDFVDGQQVATYTLPIVQDGDAEGDEVVFFGFGTITPGDGAPPETAIGVQSTKLTVVDDDTPVTYVVGIDTRFIEGTPSAATITPIFITVGRDDARGAADVELKLTPGPGLTALDVGLQTLPETVVVSFADGENFTRLEFNAVADVEVEGDEVLTVELQSVTPGDGAPTSTAIGRSSGTITIEDDDLPTVTYELGPDVSYVEGGINDPIARPFEITRSDPTGEAYVRIGLTGGAGFTADELAYFDSLPNEYRSYIADGETTATLYQPYIGILGDDRPEADEVLILNILGIEAEDGTPIPGAIIGDGTLQITIEDDDPPISYSLGDDIIYLEQDPGEETRVFFGVGRSATYGGVTFNLDVKLFGGLDDDDFVDPISGPQSLTLADGEMGTFDFWVLKGDYEPESEGRIEITVTSLEGAIGDGLAPFTIDKPTQTLTIRDNDVATNYFLGPDVSIRETASGIGNKGVIEVTRDTGAGFARVDINVSRGAGLTDQDFEGTLTDIGMNESYTLYFEDGQQVATAEVVVRGDNTPEQNESLTVTIESITDIVGTRLDNAFYDPQDELIVTIEDDDRTTYRLGANVQVPEGDSGQPLISFDVFRSDPTGFARVHFGFGDRSIDDDDGFVIDFTADFEDGELSTQALFSFDSDETPEVDDFLDVFLDRVADENDQDIALVAFDRSDNLRLTVLNDDFVEYTLFGSGAFPEGDNGLFIPKDVVRSDPRGEAEVELILDRGTTDEGEIQIPASVFFEDGDLRARMEIRVETDTVPEPDETFFVRLGEVRDGAGNVLPWARLGTSLLEFNVLNDDVFATYSLSGTSATVREGNGALLRNFATVSVTRTDASGDAQVYLDISGSEGVTVDDTVTDLSNFRVDFLDGQTVASRIVLIEGDLDVEADETLTFSINQVRTPRGNQVLEGASFDSSDTFVLTIENDDAEAFFATTKTETHDASNFAGLGGTPDDLDGDSVENFGQDDTVTYISSFFQRSDLTVTQGSAILDVDVDGDGASDSTLRLEGDFRMGDFMVVQNGENVDVTFETFLPDLADGRAQEDSAIIGVANQAFLTGDGVQGFEVTLSTIGFAGYRNVLGVYEVDEVGDIHEIQILFDDVTTARTGANTAQIADVEAGHSLGFFIVQDGESWANSLAEADTFSFVTSDGASGNALAEEALYLAVNGARADVNSFHSFNAALNFDGAQHVLSGVDPGGRSMTIGFEDLTGTGDRDYEDVVFSVGLLDVA